ncbi:NADP-dependent oxidoreductase [Pedosphaera parvula]|uniref:Alcohol dehydrogenase zinc-binding domain protein n=1 Tax=Pedosphaera parvula (strain Ellin514) TaxID=320771 RepID=B9XK95_PEDPL|nr:NADP-dependent oxidoreductase [Pedosphaera parvula]EEF59733.1 Alcohol dehydrogenase zinc-binding domain protein [Pedosphaera parvula Ellin514]
MKAIYLEKKTGHKSIILGDIPQPYPREGEALIKVHATGIMPTEFRWFPTFNTPEGKPRRFPIVLSHEFSGTIEALGAGVTGFEVDDPVFGLNDWFTNGAEAEYCVAPATALAQKPKSLDYIHAAVTPISALTAWQGLFERLKLERGQRLLIHGGAGAVGTFAVQLAHWHGAHVIATASSANLDFVHSLGADEVIDYHQTPFENVVRDISAVFDVVGGDTLQRSWNVLKTGGKLVTVATQSEGATDQRTRDAFMLVRADGSQLAEIVKLIDAGELRVFVAGVFPLAEAREAYDRAQEGKLRGKIALRVAE